MTDLISDLEEKKINFLRQQAEEYKAKIKPVPKEWAGLSSQGQVNLDLRKKVKYFKWQINLGETLLQRREDLNREIMKLKKGTSATDNDLNQEKSVIMKMIEEKKELDLEIKKAAQRKKKHFIEAKSHLNKQIAEAIKDHKAKGGKEEEEEDSLDKKAILRMKEELLKDIKNYLRDKTMFTKAF